MLGRQPERLESEPALRGDSREDSHAVDDRSLLAGGAVPDLPKPYHVPRSLVREPGRGGRGRSKTLLDPDGSAGEAFS